MDPVRGHATWALGVILAHRPERSSLVSDALDRLCDDPAVSVRASLAGALVHTLAIDPTSALDRFRRLSEATPRWFLGLPPVRQFVHYATYHDDAAIRGVLMRALDSGSAATLKTAPGQIALAGLVNARARPDAAEVRSGSEQTRSAAAEIYPSNCFSPEYGEECRIFLMSAFFDESVEVQKEAAEFAWRSPLPELASDVRLLKSFVESPAFGSDRISTLLLRLSDAPSLPIELMPLIGRKGLAIIGDAGGNIATAASADAHTLTPLVFRAYAEARDPAVRRQLLDMIDEAIAMVGWESTRRWLRSNPIAMNKSESE